MEKVKGEDAVRVALQDLVVFDPDNPPYQQQHLCEYLSELEEPAGAEEEGE